MQWFADPVPIFWGGLLLVAIGLVMEFIRNGRK